MLQKSDLFTPNTKTSLLETIENSLEIIKLDNFGGPELKFHMEMARNMIETFPASIDIAEVMNIIKDIASFGLSVFKLEVPLDETFSLGEKVFKWLRGKVRENAVKSFYELYLTICILSNNDIEEAKANIEIEKLRTYTTKDSIRVGTILLIQKLIMKIRNLNTLNKLKDILIPLLSKDDNILPVVLRICIELNDSNFPFKKEFQNWWETYFDSNFIRFKASKSQLVRMLVENNAASYLQVLNEDRTYLSGISYELYEKMISNFSRALQDVNDVYLDLSVAETKKLNDNLYDLHSKIIEFLDKREEKVCIAFGDSGSGKSIYCNKLAHHLLTTKSGYLPIYVYLPLFKAKVEGDLIETVLKKNKIDLTDDLKSRKILFILDAYDELNSYPNIIVSNQIIETFENSKVLFTCRTNEAPPNLNTFANKDATGKPDKYSTLYIQPLSKDSIEHYARKVVDLNIGWKSFDELWNIINQKEVLQLLSNPFLLGACLKNPSILNNLNSQHTKINIVRTYQEYINVYQYNEYYKIDNQKHDLEEMQEIYTEAAIEYAFKIIEKGNLSRTDISKQELVSRGCLLKESSNKSYSFLHPSIGDYFVALGVIRIAKGWNSIKDVKQINRVELMERYKVLDFIKEMMNECSQEDKNLIQEALFSIVRLRDPKQGLASSNALSILNYCGRSLHGQDLSGICAKKANLRYACLINARLNRSDLEGANLSHSNLYKAQMKNCNLLGVNLGILYRDMKHSNLVHSVAFSIDNIISSSEDTTIKVWDFETGDLKYTLEGHSYAVKTLAVSNDNQYIISGSYDKTIKIWDLDLGYLKKTLQVHSGGVACLFVTSDNKFIVSGSWEIVVCDFNTGEIKHTLQGHSGDINTIFVTRDNRLIISGSSDETIKVWVFETGELINTLEGHTGEVKSVYVSYDSRFIVSGDYSGVIKVWELDTGNLKYNLQGHSTTVLSLVISTDDQIIVSSSADRTIIVWELETGEIKHTLRGHSNWVSAVAVSSDNKFIASGSFDKSIKIWNLENGDSRQNFHSHSNFVHSVVVSRNNRLIISSSEDKTIKVWDFETGDLKFTLEGHSDAVKTLAVSNDNQYIASGSYDKTVRVWELNSGILKRTLEGHSDSVVSVVISNHNELIISASWDKLINVWDFKTGELKHTLKGHSGYILSLTLSKDDRLVLSGSVDKTVKVWRLETGELINTLDGHDESVDSVAVSYDNSLIVSGTSTEEIKVWELETGKLKYTIEGDSKMNQSCSIVLSRNNQFIISAYWNGKIQIRELETGDLLNTIQGYAEYFTSIDLSPDDQYILTGGANRAVKMWKLQTERSDCLVWSTYQGFCALGCEFEGSKLSRELETTLNYYRSNIV